MIDDDILVEASWDRLNAYGVARDKAKCLRNEAVSCLKLQGLRGDFDVLNTGTRRLLYTHDSESALEASCEQQQLKVNQCSSHGRTYRWFTPGTGKPPRNSDSLAPYFDSLVL